MTMKTAWLTASALIVGMAASMQAGADVLNFDDLGSGSAFFTENYKGFQIGTNSAATNAWFYTSQSSPFYTPKSGAGFISTDFNLYNGGLYDATQPISRSTAFVFDGAWFSGDSSIGYKLYAGNSLVYTSTPSATLTSAPIFVASGYTGFVNSVVVLGHQGFYALDDFTFRNTVSAPPVPEPATWAMMLVGLGGIGFAMRRRRSKVTANVSFA